MLSMRPASIEIIKKIKAAGFKAYWAGGCVRDMLLGVEPKDFDIATSAKPQEIKEILKKTIPIGEQFGVVLAEENGHHFEIATFRSDSGYSDGRRPDAVTFTHAEDDAKRRDFTINGMFYDPVEDRVFDFVEGQRDLDAGLVRFIGEPDERILEDHLRILRAIRFKNTLKAKNGEPFQYHPDTFRAVKHHALLIAKVSSERVRDELNKMLISDRAADALEDMEDTGVLEVILPELQALKGVAQPLEYHKEGDVWDHMIGAVRALKPDAPRNLRWAVMLHDIAKPETFKLEERIRYDKHAERSGELARSILKRLKFSSKDIEHVAWLVEHHMSVYNVLDMSIGRRRHWFLHEWFLELLEVNRCDIAGTVPANYETYEKVYALYRADMREMPQRPARLLTGEEIMEVLKIKPGPQIQKILDELHELQLEKKITTKKEAEEWLQSRQKTKNKI